jgi:hypothetical protein
MILLVNHVMLHRSMRSALITALFSDVKYISDECQVYPDSVK